MHNARSSACQTRARTTKRAGCPPLTRLSRSCFVRCGLACVIFLALGSDCVAQTARPAPATSPGTLLSGLLRGKTGHPASAAELSGTWQGTYLCTQGETGISVELSGDDSGAVQGTVKFYPTEHSTVTFAPASYSVSGTFLSDGRLLLKPGQWIEKPGNYFMGTLDGTISQDRQSYTGRIPECGFNRHFIIARQAGGATPNPGASSTGATPAKIPDGDQPIHNDVDILGLKLGMSPDQARPLVKARKLQNYLELSQELAFPDPVTGIALSIPNGNMLTFIVGASGNRGYGRIGGLSADYETLSASFTPVPGAERLVMIVHKVGLRIDEALREDSFYNALTAKYGAPVHVERRNGFATWLFGKARLRTANPQQLTCNTLSSLAPVIDGITKDMRVVETEAVRDNASVNLLLRSFPSGNYGKASFFAAQAVDCGDATLQVHWGGPNPTAGDSERLVAEYDISVMSPPLAAEDLGKANRLATDAAHKAQTKALDKASDQKKPDL